MQPSEVRERILADHAVLRADLDRLELMAAAAREPDPDSGRVAGLREEGQRFLERLELHMRWEEAYLLPMLREIDAWGQERADRFVAEHREQREILQLILTRLRDAGRPDPIIARDLEGLVGLLRKDMHEEESDFLDDRVLRDDIIAIEVETG